MKSIKLWFLALLFLPIWAHGQNCIAPPAPYVGDAHAACGCESATAKAQHRDPLTFQSLPGKTIVWYGNPLHEGTPLPSGVDAGDSNVSICNSANFPTPLSIIYAFETMGEVLGNGNAVILTGLGGLKQPFSISKA